VSVASDLSQPLRGASTAPGKRAHSEFERIFLEHYALVFRILTRLVGCEQAEELANEVFFRLSRQPEQWLVANVGGWLHRAATRAGIDALRSSAMVGYAAVYMIVFLALAMRRLQKRDL